MSFLSVGRDRHSPDEFPDSADELVNPCIEFFAALVRFLPHGLKVAVPFFVPFVHPAPDGVTLSLELPPDPPVLLVVLLRLFDVAAEYMLDPVQPFFRSHFFFLAFLALTATLAAAARLATSLLCSGVIFSILADPLIFPPRFPSARKYASTSSGSFFLTLPSLTPFRTAVHFT